VLCFCVKCSRPSRPSHEVISPILYFRPNDGSKRRARTLGRVKSKGVTDRLRPNDGSKMAIGSFKSQRRRNQNPEGGEAEAEARRAASAQAFFPSRRAREKAEQKGGDRGSGYRQQARQPAFPVVGPALRSGRSFDWEN